MINPSQAKLVIVVLNWNSYEDTANCINSLLPQLRENQKIIVVDNGSTDNSVEKLSGLFTSIECVCNKINMGFQGGMNTGIRYALEYKADFVMLLNCDTFAMPNMIEILFRLMPKDAAIVSPGIYYMTNPDQLCSTGGWISPILLDTLHKAKIKNPDVPLKMEFLPSHAWLIRTEILEKTGLLDESFFPLYYDDLDFCFRLKRFQYPLYLIPSAKILHNVSLSMGGENSPKERYLMARNSGYYFRKHMRLWQYPIIFPYRFVSAILWTFRLLSSKSIRAISTYWKGFFQGWFGKLP